MEGYIEGATTLLCMPHKNNATSIRHVSVKNGWLKSDCVNGTCKNRGQKNDKFFIFPSTNLPLEALRWKKT